MPLTPQERQIRKKFFQICSEFKSRYNIIVLPNSLVKIPPTIFQPTETTINISPIQLGPCHFCQDISTCDLLLIRMVRRLRNPSYKKLASNSNEREFLNNDDGGRHRIQ